MMNAAQSGDAWHALRLKGIGSSDAAIVLGISPYMTPLQLWEEKTGLVPRTESEGFILQKGHESEIRMRAIYELECGFEIPPALVEHATYPFIRASLDGYNKERGIAVEFKLVGKEAFENAKAGKIPPHHMAQLDHILLILGVGSIDYVCTDGARRCTVSHLANLERVKKLLSAEIKFWQYVEFGEAPPLTDLDFKKIQDKELTKKIVAWKKAKMKLDEAEDAEAALKKEIISMCNDHPRMRGAGVKIQKGFRNGSIDYSAIEILKGIDLEGYRKKGSEFWRIDIEK